jgi:oligopeptide transport system substrate-binding protein
LIFFPVMTCSRVSASSSLVYVKRKDRLPKVVKLRKSLIKILWRQVTIRTLFLILAASAFALLVACSAPESANETPTGSAAQASPTSTPRPTVRSVSPVPILTPKPVETPRPKVLRVNGGALPEVLDPQKSTLVSEWAHLQLIFEGLTRFNENLEPVPAASEKWEYNANATELVFTLRKGLKYSDGSPLNATRFAYALKRNINPQTAGDYTALTDDIKGALDWRNARPDLKPEDAKKLESAVDASIQPLDAGGKPCKTGNDGYTQDDCLTLKLVFAQPAPYFHVIVGTWVAYPIKEENVGAVKDIWNTLKSLVGNGPFVVKSIEPGMRVRFEANPNYRGDKAQVAIEYTYLADSAAVQAYKKNDLDVVVLVSDDIEKVQADADVAKQLVMDPGACTFAGMFALDKEPFTDPKVRQAFALAIDRDAWVKEALHGAGSPTLTWIPKGFPGYPSDEKRWAFDASAAKKALSESKYVSADKLPPITLTFVDNTRNRPRFEWLQKKWKEVLGVDAKLNPVDQTAYANLSRDPKTAPMLYLQGWCAVYPDPQYWLSLYWKTGTVAERIKYSNKSLDQILNEADATADPKKRLELYGKAHDMLMVDAPAVFIWNSVNMYLVKPWVKNYKSTPQNRWFPGDANPLAIDIDTTQLPK